MVWKEGRPDPDHCFFGWLSSPARQAKSTEQTPVIQVKRLDDPAHLAKPGMAYDYERRPGAGGERPAAPGETGLNALERQSLWRCRDHRRGCSGPDRRADIPALARGLPGRPLGDRLLVQGRDPVRAQSGRLSPAGAAGSTSQGANRRALARHFAHGVLTRGRFRGDIRGAGSPRESEARHARPSRHRRGRVSPGFSLGRLL